MRARQTQGRAASRERHPAPCPDCNAQSGRELRHHLTCPLGRGMEGVSADDRLWFSLHPYVYQRRRAPAWAEVVMLREFGMLPRTCPVNGDVVVTKDADGIRAKRLEPRPT